jgi:hypothetical protein
VDGSGKKECLAKARDSMQKAVCLCSSSASIWNALGVVCSLSSKYNKDRACNQLLGPLHLHVTDIADVALAQHCFIKSLQLNSTNAMAWSNLGVLYLINDKKEVWLLSFIKGVLLEVYLCFSLLMKHLRMPSLPIQTVSMRGLDRP